MPLSIRLPKELEGRLTKLAKRTGRSKTYYVTEAIAEHMQDLEDIYLAEQRLIALQSGKTKTIPLSDVMKTYGMED